ncbi:hypothetical protein [Marmoricola endophyticus]|uniref:hypothetical protein n=1 Tax=Marmoricola endophyticus TaxID=2040280 RepID=UPI001664ECAF|nr:hypothetical protein [Marmoricola endophyticus]
MGLRPRPAGHRLYVRQLRAFDREGVAADFEVSPGWQVSTMSAIGSVVPAAPGEPPRPEEPRVRRAGDDLVWPRAGVTER